MNSVTLNIHDKEYPLKGFIFDFDGVVLDTETYHYRSWLEAAELEGCSFAYSDYVPLKSTGTVVISKHILEHSGRKPEEDAIRRIYTAKEAIFQRLVAGLSEKDILPGIPEFLAFLNEKGVKLAVASSSHASGALAARFGLDKFFHVLIDGRTPLPRKPAPDTFLLAAERLGVDPEDCIVFEDSFAGIGGAVNAKMPVVAIGGIQSKDAVLHLQDFSEFIKYFH